MCRGCAFVGEKKEASKLWFSLGVFVITGCPICPEGKGLRTSKLNGGRREDPAMIYGEWMFHFGYERDVKILMVAELRVGPLLIITLDALYVVIRFKSRAV